MLYILDLQYCCVYAVKQIISHLSESAKRRRSFTRVIIRKRFSETFPDAASLIRESNSPFTRIKREKNILVRIERRAGREEGVAQNRERSFVAELFSRNVRNDLSLTISPCGGGSRCLVDRYAVIRT